MKKKSYKKRLLSSALALAVVFTLASPVAQASLAIASIPDGRIETAYPGIYLDNNNMYYSDSSGKAIYLDKITFTSSDVSYVYEISDEYNLPEEVTDKLVASISDCEGNDEVSLFVPIKYQPTRSSYWSEVYTLTHQGVTFTLQDYYVATTKSTGYHDIGTGARTAAIIENITNYSVWCADVMLGALAISSISPMSLLSLFVNAGLNRSMTGSDEDYCQVNFEYSLTERMTYVKTTNGWSLNYITTAAVLAHVFWHYFVANETTVAKRNIRDDAPINKTFYSVNYYDAAVKAVSTLSLKSDPPLSIEVGTMVLFMA